MGQGGQFEIINGTPYSWTVTHSHSYQMNSWPFKTGDVFPAFTSTKRYVEFSEGVTQHTKDDAGDANFSINGPGQGHFVLNVVFRDLRAVFSDFACTNWPASNALSLGWNHNGTTPFVLSGTVGHFITSADSPNWMQSSLSALGNMPLGKLCLPASHDTGMYVINGSTAGVSIFGTGIVLTQAKNVGAQLRAGARWFDIRPDIAGGVYKTGHYSKLDLPVVGSGWQGANGEVMDDIISEVNAFTSNNAELVVLRLSHSLNTDVGNKSYRSFTEDEWQLLLGHLKSLQNLFIAPNDQQDLTKLTLQDYIGSGKAAVVVVFEETVDLGDMAYKGFYPVEAMIIYNEYSESDVLSTMTTDQLNKMHEQVGQGNYFLLSWTLTQDTGDVVGGPSIAALASQANSSLSGFWNDCSKTMYPNVISVDFFDNKDTALAVALCHQASLA